MGKNFSQTFEEAKKDPKENVLWVAKVKDNDNRTTCKICSKSAKNVIRR